MEVKSKSTTGAGGFRKHAGERNERTVAEEQVLDQPNGVCPRLQKINVNQAPHNVFVMSCNGRDSRPLLDITNTLRGARLFIDGYLLVDHKIKLEILNFPVAQQFEQL